MANFAIIGAGLAGVSLASRLKSAGHLCTVFEKNSDCGGRLSTYQMPDWQIDHGTQYFTVRSEAFSEEVAKWQQNGWVTPWSVQPWLLERERFEPSDDDRLRFVGIPTMNAMVKGLSDNLTIYYDTRIDRLEAQQNKWRLWDQQGEHYGDFDAIILAAPLAQSLALLPFGSIAETSLRTATMSPTLAFALALKGRSGISADALFSNDGIVTWAAKDSSKPGRDNKYETWIVHFSAQWTANHLDASEQLLQQQVVDLLERLSGGKIPEVHQTFMHRWLYARSAASTSTIVQWDANQHIGLAGDWTLGNRLEDAWLSAERLAKSLTESFSV